MKLFASVICGAALVAGASSPLSAADASNPYAPLAYKPLCKLRPSARTTSRSSESTLRWSKSSTLHVTPPGVAVDVDTDRHLFFGNIGRIGKLDNADDGEAFRGGKEVIELQDKPSPPSPNFSITAAPKYEVLGMLRTKSGEKIGLTVMVFPYHVGTDVEVYHKIAQTICDELASRIDDKEQLFAAAP